MLHISARRFAPTLRRDSRLNTAVALLCLAGLDNAVICYAVAERFRAMQSRCNARPNCAVARRNETILCRRRVMENLERLSLRSY